MEENIRFKLNGKSVSLTVDPERMLLWVLRSEFGLTGTKYGCGEGYCGACTVLVDGEVVRSCQTPIKEVRSKEVLTIEGLASDGKLHPLQEAFIKHNAMQCGFCPSGMILNADRMLKKNPRPARAEIIAAMDDNFCRCGSQTLVLRAIEAAESSTSTGTPMKFRASPGCRKSRPSSSTTQTFRRRAAASRRSSTWEQSWPTPFSMEQERVFSACPSLRLASGKLGKSDNPGRLEQKPPRPRRETSF